MVESALREAAERGVAEAMHELGLEEMFSEDRFGHQKGMRWLKMAADKGLPEAQFDWACNLRRFPSSPTDLFAAGEIFAHLSRSGNTGAMAQFAEMKFNGELEAKDDGAAFEIALEAARRGAVGAQKLVGCMYLYGWGTEENSKEAEHWLEAAAKRGSARAMCLLAVALENRSVMHDKGGAISWYQASAKHGDEEALNRLQQLDDGIPLEPDCI